MNVNYIIPHGITLHDDLKIVEVTISDEIDMETSKEFRDCVLKAHKTQQTHIPVYINSPGGDIDALMSMINTIKTSTIPFITIIDGNAFSAAAVLFCYGKKRYMSRNSRLMFHGASSTLIGSMTTQEIQSESDELRIANENMYADVGIEIFNDPIYFLRLLHENRNEDLYMSAIEAYHKGICEFLYLPRMETRVILRQTLIQEENNQNETIIQSITDTRSNIKQFSKLCKKKKTHKKRKLAISDDSE